VGGVRDSDGEDHWSEARVTRGAGRGAREKLTERTPFDFAQGRLRGQRKSSAEDAEVHKAARVTRSEDPLGMTRAYTVGMAS
jgi:hypothetical protein